jgi:hypothetical protein
MDAHVARILENETFSVWCPGVFEVIEKGGQPDDETRHIGGFCSTDTLDRQNEVVVQKGLDFSEFVKYGYYNDNHKQDTSAILGVPTSAKLIKGRWYTEGNILKGYEPADRIWELAKSLHKGGRGRRLGFSIEGKVLERGGGNRITRAKIRNVAITNCPVNTDCTWDILTKAFATPDEILAADLAAADRYAKAVAAGYGMNGGGAALIPESLEGEARRIAHNDPRGDMTFEAAVDRLKHLRPHFSKAVCERIVRLAIKMKETS